MSFQSQAEVDEARLKALQISQMMGNDGSWLQFADESIIEGYNQAYEDILPAPEPAVQTPGTKEEEEQSWSTEEAKSFWMQPFEYNSPQNRENPGEEQTEETDPGPAPSHIQGEEEGSEEQSGEEAGEDQSDEEREEQGSGEEEGEEQQQEGDEGEQGDEGDDGDSEEGNEQEKDEGEEQEGGSEEGEEEEESPEPEGDEQSEPEQNPDDEDQQEQQQEQDPDVINWLVDKVNNHEERITANELLLEEHGQIHKKVFEGMNEVKENYLAMTKRYNQNTIELEQLEKQVNELKENGGGGSVITVNVVTPDKAKKVKGAHKDFSKLLKISSLKLAAYLVGPAGSGKTYAARMVAQALDLPYNMMSVGPQTSKGDIFGFRTANGDYVETPVYRAFKDGGVMFFDEMDTAHPGVAKQLKMILGEPYVNFAGQIVERHESFRMMVSANTFGRGVDRMYVGGQQQDEAFLDEFAFIDWEYDEKLERAIALSYVPEDDHQLYDLVDQHVDEVQRIREVVFAKKMRAIVSPRASKHGAIMLAGGMKPKQVLECLVKAKMSEDQWKAVNV